MEFYNEVQYPMDTQPIENEQIDNEPEYYDDDYYDDETMSKGSWECSSIDGNDADEENEEDDDFYISNTSTKTRSTFSQDIVHIESILKSKSYLDKKPDIEVIVEEVLVTSIAPWKDYEIDENQIDFNDIVKETEEEKMIEAAAVLKAAEEAASKIVEETYHNRRQHYNKRGDQQQSRKPFVKAPQVQLQPGEIDKTRLCKFGKRCVSQKKCDRVHTFDDWEPNTCHYDKKCKILHKCRFIHTRETKADYLKRIIQQEDNRFYFGNQQLYLKNFGIQLKENDKK